MLPCHYRPQLEREREVKAWHLILIAEKTSQGATFPGFSSPIPHPYLPPSTFHPPTAKFLYQNPILYPTQSLRLPSDPPHFCSPPFPSTPISSNPSSISPSSSRMVTNPPTTAAATIATTTTDVFSLLSDDTVLDILTRLISDPRDWSRLSCVSSRFSNLIRSICYRSWCCHFIPKLAADLCISHHFPGGWAALRKLCICCPGLHHAGVLLDEYPNRKCSRRPIWEPHYTSAQRGFSREEGSKLLASRFRGDCLYISQWPSCVHAENRRKYLLFRGVFRNFKETSVWKTVRDAKKSRIDAKCAFCEGKETWDLHSAFCLRRGLDLHEGEPVVRAFVCENGHVSGAWVEKPLYL